MKKELVQMSNSIQFNSIYFFSLSVNNCYCRVCTEFWRILSAVTKALSQGYNKDINVGINLNRKTLAKNLLLLLG